MLPLGSRLAGAAELAGEDARSHELALSFFSESEDAVAYFKVL
jgi:hypothetical protein